MAKVQFKQKCTRCKQKYVISSKSDKFIVCYDCQKKELDQEIEDPNFKELFNIPEEFYKQNIFLRSIKSSYLRFNNLTDRQIEAFKKVVKDLEDGNKK